MATWAEPCWKSLGNGLEIAENVKDRGFGQGRLPCMRLPLKKLNACWKVGRMPRERLRLGYFEQGSNKALSRWAMQESTRSLQGRSTERQLQMVEIPGKEDKSRTWKLWKKNSEPSLAERLTPHDCGELASRVELSWAGQSTWKCNAVGYQF